MHMHDNEIKAVIEAIDQWYEIQWDICVDEIVSQAKNTSPDLPATAVYTATSDALDTLVTLQVAKFKLQTALRKPSKPTL